MKSFTQERSGQLFGIQPEAQFRWHWQKILLMRKRRSLQVNVAKTGIGIASDKNRIVYSYDKSSSGRAVFILR